MILHLFIFLVHILKDKPHLSKPHISGNSEQEKKKQISWYNFSFWGFILWEEMVIHFLRCYIGGFNVVWYAMA